MAEYIKKLYENNKEDLPPINILECIKFREIMEKNSWFNKMKAIDDNSKNGFYLSKHSLSQVKKEFEERKPLFNQFFPYYIENNTQKCILKELKFTQYFLKMYFSILSYIYIVF